MKGITNLWGREPAMILAFLQAVLAALTGFEVIDVSQEQMGLVLTATALLLGLLTRTQVTPSPGAPNPVPQPPPVVEPPFDGVAEDFGD